jgi:hypothetical protein
MKTVRILSFLFALFICGEINAQVLPIKKMPEFKNDILVVRTLEDPPGPFSNSGLNISDGSEISYYTFFETVKFKNQSVNATILAQVFNELKRQKYNLISSNSGGGGAGVSALTTYIFQRDSSK